jgi:hypothetical protein
MRLNRFSTSGHDGPRLFVHSSPTRIVTLCYQLPVPNKLHRYYGAGYLHFITISCYQRRALLVRQIP